ncbi:aminotransferase class I/II-fold pyridoxal phosphate-dependent enzyme [Lysinibacillus sp. KU-BSD001]|uniref:aminotransferase class I/II-fold pyridoxal phosphate-dependent enzyme n=1 Tax=Lysinibacillus sp. KU-BSD001 TaxID=3141328 RepID=UPI0036E657E2
MKSERPLVEALQRFVEKEPQSLHVPGHKNGLISTLPKPLKKALIYDVTELTGLDDFHYPEEAIEEAQKLLAKTYGADYSFFLVNGSTVGNLAMIYATCKRGDTIFVQRNAHKSVFHAIELVGAKPIYLAPEWDEHTKSAGAVPLDTVKEALTQHPEGKALVLTYPTYYGIVAKDLKEQIALCHAQNIPVLVDEAHGAHFTASERFPTSALDLGADVVVQSAHKTLPAMTMASFMHVKSTLVSNSKINHYLRMLQSSSPSYLLLASLDDARHYISKYMESDAVYCLEKRNQWIEALRSIPSLEVIEVDDPLKVCIRLPGYTGMELKAALEESELYVELADIEQVLAVLPLLKHGEIYPYADIRIRVKNAVAQLKKKEGNGFTVASRQYEMAPIITPNMSFDEVDMREKEWIPYMRAIGRIAAGMLIPYPPGIPLFVPGEKITVGKLSQLEELLAIGATFQGTHRLEERFIQVLK